MLIDLSANELDDILAMIGLATGEGFGSDITDSVTEKLEAAFKRCRDTEAGSADA